MRKFLAALIVVVSTLTIAAPAGAVTETLHYKHHDIKYSFHWKASAHDPRYAIREFAKVDRRMRVRARRKFDAHQRALARARRLATLAPANTSTAPAGGVWGCLAQHEEGGRNDPNHGYFGFIGLPPAFGVSASSWLELSWDQQVHIAEGVDPVSGWPNTGPICGLW